jgi:uncharacterized protein YkwD
MRAQSATKKLIATAAALAGALSILAAGTASAAEPVDCRYYPDNDYAYELGIDLTLDEVDMEFMVNDLRADHALAPRTVNRDLARAAAWATHDSALRGFSPSDHVDTLGRDITQRFGDCGVEGYSQWAEINYYATGVEVSDSAVGALTWWMNSPGHRALLLDPELTEMGIALGYIGEIGQVQDWNRAHWTITFGG